MRRHLGRTALVLGFVLGCPAAFADVSKVPTHAPNGAYQLETAHSQILFSILHLGLTNYWGRFDRLSGTLDFDGNQPEKSHVAVSIDMTSVDTPNARLNEELKGKRVFDSGTFPAATFESTGIARSGPDHGTITGNLTIRNVTKPVKLDVVFGGTDHNPIDDSPALAFHATATIKRSDFGLTGMVWSPFVGDSVQLTIEAMFQRSAN